MLFFSQHNERSMFPINTGDFFFLDMKLIREKRKLIKIIKFLPNARFSSNIKYSVPEMLVKGLNPQALESDIIQI